MEGSTVISHSQFADFSTGASIIISPHFEVKVLGDPHPEFPVPYPHSA